MELRDFWPSVKIKLGDAYPIGECKGCIFATECSFGREILERMSSRPTAFKEISVTCRKGLSRVDVKPGQTLFYTHKAPDVLTSFDFYTRRKPQDSFKLREQYGYPVDTQRKAR